jgi:hypothetical protein
MKENTVAVFNLTVHKKPAVMAGFGTDETVIIINGQIFEGTYDSYCLSHSL